MTESPANRPHPIIRWMVSLLVLLAFAGGAAWLVWWWVRPGDDDPGAIGLAIDAKAPAPTQYAKKGKGKHKRSGWTVPSTRPRAEGIHETPSTITIRAGAAIATAYRQASPSGFHISFPSQSPDESLASILERGRVRILRDPAAVRRLGLTEEQVAQVTGLPAVSSARAEPQEREQFKALLADWQTADLVGKPMLETVMVAALRELGARRTPGPRQQLLSNLAAIRSALSVQQFNDLVQMIRAALAVAPSRPPTRSATRPTTRATSRPATRAAATRSAATRPATRTAIPHPVSPPA